MKCYRERSALSYEGVLERIDDCLKQVDQWAHRYASVDGVVLDSHHRSAYEHQLRAETLIELLEVHNCGSVGGYDDGQQNSGQWRTLRQRYEWLKSGTDKIVKSREQNND